jgi:hypothetical protein
MDQQLAEKSELADDLLRGAEDIGAYIGLTRDQVYQEAKKKRKKVAGAWPIGRLPGGRELIASKTALERHAHKHLSAD